jgi:glycosyltransferase involved in cell wall biosynthesis
LSALKVAFVSSYTGLGGGETSLLSLLGAFERARVEPILLCPREGQLPEAARRLGVAVQIVPWRPANAFFLPRPAARTSGAAALRAKFEETGAVVVHSDFHTLPLAVGAQAGRGGRVVFTCWGWWFHPRFWQRSFYLRESLRIVAASHAIRRGFLGDPPFMAPQRIKVVHPGVDSARYRPRPDERDDTRRTLGLEIEAPLVTLVARFQWVKGHDVFLDAARLVLRDVPQAQFAIAGENAFGVAADDRYRHQITRKIGSDPLLRDRVRLLGWVERSERLMAACDVVVVSSRFESFGMVGVEAMSSGVPVVSINRGGPAETIVDGETGFLVPPEQPGAIAAQVVTLLGDPALRRRMGEAGRARVQARFTVERYAARMTEIFEAAAGGGP